MVVGRPREETDYAWNDLKEEVSVSKAGPVGDIELFIRIRGLETSSATPSRGGWTPLPARTTYAEQSHQVVNLEFLSEIGLCNTLELNIALVNTRDQLSRSKDSSWETVPSPSSRPALTIRWDAETRQ